MSDLSFHADQIEAAINEAVADLGQTKISVEISGGTADMLVHLTKVSGWDVTTVLSYLLDQTRQLANRGLATPDFIDATEAETFRALIPEGDVNAAVWPRDLKVGDIVMDGDHDPAVVCRLWFGESSILVDTANDWCVDKDGELAEFDETLTWELKAVVKLTDEDAATFKAFDDIYGPDGYEFIESLRAKYAVTVRP